MIAVPKRIKEIFVNPKGQMSTVVLPNLRLLAADLREVKLEKDSLTGIIKFFNIMSPWGDNGGVGNILSVFQEVNYGQYNEVIEELKTLQMHFINAGRDKYGMNRTEVGQLVTADNVFLGNICGLFTKSVAYWKQRINEPSEAWGFNHESNLNAHGVVSKQAKSFMDSHVDPIIVIVEKLEEKF